jgi:hypothetical protein
MKMGLIVQGSVAGAYIFFAALYFVQSIEKRHQRADSGWRFSPDSEQRPHRLRD